MHIDLETVKKQTADAVTELFAISPLHTGELFVLGCSSSEICGAHIGKAGNAEVGAAVIETILPIIKAHGGYLAVQGCEHINRALVVEREAVQKYGLEVVSVVPALHAGGSCAVAAYHRFHDPVMVEHITAKMGMDIGDTAIGMHIKFVQVPVRLTAKEIGGAHLTALTSRPKLIGGERAQYQ